MIDPKRREMFVDLYRITEYCEDPKFTPGEIELNGKFFENAVREKIVPFLEKYKALPLAEPLVMVILDDCSKRAAEFNKM